ncbi:hypothetical protein ARTHRO9V_240025 [Arthrobacter sp. 9V]|nr:hypothetical protein ARTHRO9V_240025 [Arthrobacter sp. 9V]
MQTVHQGRAPASTVAGARLLAGFGAGIGDPSVIAILLLLLQGTCMEARCEPAEKGHG